MSYLGSMNPYMTPEEYAKALRQRQMMLQGGTPQAPQMSPNPQAGPQMSPNREPTREERLGALIRRGNIDTTAADNELKRQKAYANSLMATKSAGPRQLGNVVVNNPWEGLEVGFNRAMGGYLAGKAREKDEAMQAKRDDAAEARAELAAIKMASALDQQDIENRQTDRALAIDEMGEFLTGISGNDPTAQIQNYEYLMGLPEDQRPAFMSVFRGANVQSDDTGVYIVQPDGTKAYVTSAADQDEARASSTASDSATTSITSEAEAAPAVMDAASQTLDVVSKIKELPLDGLIGPFDSRTPDVSDNAVLLDNYLRQIQGREFVANVKKMGSAAGLSETEAQYIIDAANAIDRRVSDPEVFKQALADYEVEVQKFIAKAQDAIKQRDELANSNKDVIIDFEDLP